MFPAFVEIPKSFSSPACASAWTEERPLPPETKARLLALANAMEGVTGRRPDVKLTETWICWEDGGENRKLEGEKLWKALLVDSEFTPEWVVNFYRSYGPLLNKKEMSLNDIKACLWGFVAIGYCVLPSLHSGGLEAAAKEILVPLFVAERVGALMGKKNKTFYLGFGEDRFEFFPKRLRLGWPLFALPKEEEDIAEWFKHQAWKNTARWLSAHVKIDVKQQKAGLAFHVTPKDLFTYALAYMVFGTQERKKCACGCGLPALHGNYYNATHKRRCISTRPKQNAIAYFNKMLDGKNNKERHEAIKKEINRLWDNGVEDYGELIHRGKAFMKKKFGVAL